MIRRPADMPAFEFAVLSGLRSAQLQRGCTPRVDRREKLAVTAQQEIAERKVRAEAPAAGGLPQSKKSDGNSGIAVRRSIGHHLHLK